MGTSAGLLIVHFLVPFLLFLPFLLSSRIFYLVSRHRRLCPSLLLASAYLPFSSSFFAVIATTTMTLMKMMTMIIMMLPGGQGQMIEEHNPQLGAQCAFHLTLGRLSPRSLQTVQWHQKLACRPASTLLRIRNKRRRRLHQHTCTIVAGSINNSHAALVGAKWTRTASPAKKRNTYKNPTGGHGDATI